MALAAHFAAPMVFATVTRLLIDLNRSLDHPEFFSQWSSGLPGAERGRLIDEHWRPDRSSVTGLLDALVADGQRVLHAGVHSCADVLGGRRRELEVGLLLDPASPSEVEVAERWRAGIATIEPSARCRFNESYLGTDDGLTTTLRRRLGPAAYAGIELELRQGLIERAAGRRRWAAIVGEALAPIVSPSAATEPSTSIA